MVVDVLNLPHERERREALREYPLHGPYKVVSGFNRALFMACNHYTKASFTFV